MIYRIAVMYNKGVLYLKWVFYVRTYVCIFHFPKCYVLPTLLCTAKSIQFFLDENKCYKWILFKIISLWKSAFEFTVDETSGILKSKYNCIKITFITLWNLI